MTNFFPVRDPKQAKQDGYRSITRPYHLNHRELAIRLQEREWWQNACRDLQNCNCVIVEYSTGVELWRHEDQLDVDPQTGLKVNGYLPKNA